MKKLLVFLVVVWMTKSFFGLGDTVNFINSLPIESAKTAKVFSCNTSAVANSYSVIYMVE